MDDPQVKKASFFGVPLATLCMDLRINSDGILRGKGNL